MSLLVRSHLYKYKNNIPFSAFTIKPVTFLSHELKDTMESTQAFLFHFIYGYPISAESEEVNR